MLGLRRVNAGTQRAAPRAKDSCAWQARVAVSPIHRGGETQAAVGTEAAASTWNPQVAVAAALRSEPRSPAKQRPCARCRYMKIAVGPKWTSARLAPCQWSSPIYVRTMSALRGSLRRNTSERRAKWPCRLRRPRTQRIGAGAVSGRAVVLRFVANVALRAAEAPSIMARANLGPRTIPFEP